MIKKLIFTLGLVALSIQLMAQSEAEYLGMVRDVIQMEKKAIILEEIDFTEAESGPFWALYDEYEQKMNMVHDKRVNLIKDFAANYENLTNEKADELYTNALNYEKELNKLKASYYKKFKKVVPAGKAALFMQIDSKIETLVDAELALEIPLIDTK